MPSQTALKMAIGEGSYFLPVNLDNRIVPFSRYVAFAALTHRKRGEPTKRPRDDPDKLSDERERPESFHRARSGARGHDRQRLQ